MPMIYSKLLEVSLKQRQSDLMAQRSTLLERIQKLENTRYETMFENGKMSTADGLAEINLQRRQLDITSGQIAEVKFWLFDMLPAL